VGLSAELRKKPTTKTAFVVLTRAVQPEAL
jgi:hypothetical protein